MNDAFHKNRTAAGQPLRHPTPLPERRQQTPVLCWTVRYTHAFGTPTHLQTHATTKRKKENRLDASSLFGFAESSFSAPPLSLSFPPQPSVPLCDMQSETPPPPPPPPPPSLFAPYPPTRGCRSSGAPGSQSTLLRLPACLPTWTDRQVKREREVQIAPSPPCAALKDWARTPPSASTPTPSPAAFFSPPDFKKKKATLSKSS